MNVISSILYVSLVISYCILSILGCDAINLGTGHGASVLEMVAAFEKASGKVVFRSVSHSLPCKYSWFVCSTYTVTFLNGIFRKFHLKCVLEDQGMQLKFMHQQTKPIQNLVGSKWFIILISYLVTLMLFTIFFKTTNRNENFSEYQQSIQYFCCRFDNIIFINQTEIGTKFYNFYVKFVIGLVHNKTRIRGELTTYKPNEVPS